MKLTNIKEIETTGLNDQFVWGLRERQKWRISGLGNWITMKSK